MTPDDIFPGFYAARLANLDKWRVKALPVPCAPQDEPGGEEEPGEVQEHDEEEGPAEVGAVGLDGAEDDEVDE